MMQDAAWRICYSLTTLTCSYHMAGLWAAWDVEFGFQIMSVQMRSRHIADQKITVIRHCHATYSARATLLAGIK